MMRALLICGALAVSAVGCGSGEGACDSSGRYCGDDYTEEECQERDDQQVNGESWSFHEGQTCAERGKESTS